MTFKNLHVSGVPVGFQQQKDDIHSYANMCPVWLVGANLKLMYVHRAAINLVKYHHLEKILPAYMYNEIMALRSYLTETGNI